MSVGSSETTLPIPVFNGSVSDNNLPSLHKDIFEHLSTVSHTLTLVVAGFLLFLCFNDKFVFFTWHPLLYTAGWVCLMMEAILVLTPDNIFSKRLSFKLRVQYHWLVQLLAVGCSTGGFFIDFINKNRNNRSHFQSMHGFIGLIAMCCCIPTCINGFASLFNVELKGLIKPSVNKLIHAVCGIVTFVLGSVAMVLGLYTWWFKHKAGEAAQIFCMMVIVFGTIWCLVRPLTTSFIRIRSMLS